MDKEKKNKRRMAIRAGILFVLGIAIVYTIVNQVFDSGDVIEVGDVAPDFTLVDLEGKTQTLSDYRGEGVFLNFWGTWCAPCKREMPYMEKYANAFKNSGVNVLAVNIAESDLKVQSFADTYGLTFPIAIDKTKEVMEVYKIRPLPTTFLIGPDGRVKKIIETEMSDDQVRTYMESIMPGEDSLGG